MSADGENVGAEPGKVPEVFPPDTVIGEHGAGLEAPLDRPRILGTTLFQWTSSDLDAEGRPRKWCTFGKPKGLSSYRIQLALGRDFEAAGVVMMFRALCGIRTWCGKPAPELETKDDFEAALSAFGDDPEDSTCVQDERFAEYFTAFNQGLYPEEYSAAMKSRGLDPQSRERVAENAAKVFRQP